MEGSICRGSIQELANIRPGVRKWGDRGGRRGRYVEQVAGGGSTASGDSAALPILGKAVGVVSAPRQRLVGAFGPKSVQTGPLDERPSLFSSFHDTVLGHVRGSVLHRPTGSECTPAL